MFLLLGYKFKIYIVFKREVYNLLTYRLESKLYYLFNEEKSNL